MTGSFTVAPPHEFAAAEEENSSRHCPKLSENCCPPPPPLLQQKGGGVDQAVSTLSFLPKKVAPPTHVGGGGRVFRVV